MSRRIKRKLLFGFIIMHLTIIMISASISTGVAIKEYLFSERKLLGEKPEKGVFEKNLIGVLMLPVLQHYMVISGGDSGYGFFAPGISHGFFLEAIFEDRSHKELNRIYIPPSIQSYEGIERYNVLLKMFQQGLKGLTKKQKEMFYNVVMSSIGQRLLKSNSNKAVRTVSMRLYIYKIPSLRDASKGGKATLGDLMQVQVAR